jgi:hypothetical protein
MDPITTSALASGKVIQTISDIGNIAARLSNNAKTTSLVEFTSAARVEPLTIVGSDCVNLEYLPDVLQSLQSLFSGYYLQAISLTATIGDIKVIKLLDKLNPSRTPTLGSFANENYNDNWRLASESYKHRLPTSKNKVALEAEKEAVNFLLGKDTLTTVRDLTNLSVGKLINVTIKGSDGKAAFEIPISIRLMVSQLPDSSMTHLLSMQTEDVSLKERYHAWRAGRISFIKDLVLCQDLISEHRKALMTDKDGTYSEIVRRVNNNKQAGLIQNNPSLATASNLVVISDATARNVEDKMGGKLSNIRIREKIFNSTYIMILVVIDRQSERITFYHRGIDAATNVGLRDIKVSNKSGGADISDFLKSYMMGNNPSL